MSATTRASIAAAVSTVDGLQGHDARPNSPQPGDSWPLVAEISRGEGAAAAVFQTTWRVAVVLGPDVGTATDQFDAVLKNLCEALQAELFVDAARPLTIPTEAGTLYGLEIIGRSE